ncbi:MAG: methyltransferase type 11 [Pseudomonadota bacterium]
MNPNVYTRPAKSLRVRRQAEIQEVFFETIPTTSEPLMLGASSECHVTPPAVATRMVAALEAKTDGRARVLEPSAGTGNLLSALINAGYRPEKLTAVELDYTLKTHLEGHFRGVNTLHGCFLAPMAEIDDCGGFHRIVMNPPFRKVKQHMNRALSLLADGTADSPAVLVALVPITYQHSGAEILEELPGDTFATCTVNTKIVRFKKTGKRTVL